MCLCVSVCVGGGSSHDGQGFRLLGTGVSGDCKLPDIGAGKLYSDPPEVQYILLLDESSFQASLIAIKIIMITIMIIINTLFKLNCLWRTTIFQNLLAYVKY